MAAIPGDEFVIRVLPRLATRTRNSAAHIPHEGIWNDESSDAVNTDRSDTVAAIPSLLAESPEALSVSKLKGGFA